MKLPHYEKHFAGYNIQNIILGGQDGLVNVLGLILGVAAGTNNPLIVLIAGLAATFAETISMGAVAYTSSNAERDYYLSELKHEKTEVKKIPKSERKEIRDIYYRKGFRGTILNAIVNKITSNRKIWVETMMVEELGLAPVASINPLRNGVVVFISTLIGSLIPLIPFLLLPLNSAVIATLISSAVALFVVGVVKARLTIGNWFRSGLELTAIGMTAALIGYFIGLGLGNLFGTNVAGVG